MNPESTPSQGSGDDRKKWPPPAIADLPRLTGLTLLTGSLIGGTGNTGGGRSTVF
jgi:hypothetical protein